MNRYEYIEKVDRARELGLAGPRDRTAHLHILDVKPLIGASGISKASFGADNLMQWYADLAAVAGLSKPQQDIKEAYDAANAVSDKIERQKAKAALDKAYPDYAEARRAAIQSRNGSAKKGTLRHGVLEDYIRHCIEKSDGKPVPALHSDIQMFVDWARENVEKFIFTEGNCYNEKLWVGGIADIGMKIKDDGGVLDMEHQVKREGQILIGDHKSSREAFPQQFLQAALYDLLLADSGILDAQGNHLGDWKPADGIVIFPFRSDPFTPEFKWDIDKWRKGAEDAVSLYKLIAI